MKHLFWCLLLICTAMPTAQSQAQNQSELVVFVQPKRSISRSFIRHSLPNLKALAKSQNVSLKVMDATQGAPEEVTVTPSVFLKSGDEFTLYQGRYNDPIALKTFMFNGQGTAENNSQRKHTMTWKSGRSTIAAHCKMHPMKGKSSGFDETKAWEAFQEGMNYFTKADNASLPATARHFYLDFFPEKTSDGLMLIHLKLYSGFDMKNPVFVSQLPSGSEWKEWQVAFEKAGKRLETQLLAQVGSNENGDGFEFVKNKIPNRSWNSLTASVPEKEIEMIAQFGK